MWLVYRVGKRYRIVQFADSRLANIWDFTHSDSYFFTIFPFINIIMNYHMESLFSYSASFVGQSLLFVNVIVNNCIFNKLGKFIRYSFITYIT